MAGIELGRRAGGHAPSLRQQVGGTGARDENEHKRAVAAGIGKIRQLSLIDQRMKVLNVTDDAILLKLLILLCAFDFL